VGSTLRTLAASLVSTFGPFETGKPVPTPDLRLTHVQLGLGSLLDKIAGPVLKQVADHNPLGPVVDVLSAPVPVINKPLFDILVTDNDFLTQQTKDVATFLFQIAKTVDRVADEVAMANSNNVVFDLGDIV